MNAAETVVDKFNELGVGCSLAGVVDAPQVTRVELQPAEGVLMRDFSRLSRAADLEYALGAKSVRIQAPIPGRKVVGVEFSREDRQQVTLDDLPDAHGLLIPLGVDMENRPALLPLDDAPHCLIAGATGSGKSTCINAILCKLLSALGPDELRLCLIDPKKVELISYDGIAHLAAPIADSTEKAVQQLNGLIEAQERRYDLGAALGARNLDEINRALVTHEMDPLPHIVCVVDELAELMVVSKKEVETIIVRLAQKGRAAGIHLILATQSPRVDVISGLLKVNIPTRVCFAVPTMTDSRVVLDQNGAEKLLGAGDGLLSFGGLEPTRFQGAYVSSDEVASITDHWRGVLA